MTNEPGLMNTTILVGFGNFGGMPPNGNRLSESFDESEEQCCYTAQAGTFLDEKSTTYCRYVL